MSPTYGKMDGLRESGWLGSSSTASGVVTRPSTAQGLSVDQLEAD